MPSQNKGFISPIKMNPWNLFWKKKIQNKICYFTMTLEDLGHKWTSEKQSKKSRKPQFLDKPHVLSLVHILFYREAPAVKIFHHLFIPCWINLYDLQCDGKSIRVMKPTILCGTSAHTHQPGLLLCAKDSKSFLPSERMSHIFLIPILSAFCFCGMCPP